MRWFSRIYVSLIGAVRRGGRRLRSGREAISSLLRSAGYRCATFDSGEAFFASGRASQLDRILPDIRMPGMSGLDLHRALTQMGSSGLPVIYVTATHDGGLRERALSQGAAAFLAENVRRRRSAECHSSCSERSWGGTGVARRESAIGGLARINTGLLLVSSVYTKVYSTPEPL